MAFLKRLADDPIFIGNRSYDFVSKPINLNNAHGFAIVSKATNTTPSPQTFDPSSVMGSLFILPNHGFITGTKVRLTTSGTLPAGLATNTDYFVIRNTDGIIRLSASLEDALNLVFITTSDGGSGTHTISAGETTLPVLSLEASIDNEIWAPIANSSVKLSDTPILIEHEAAFYYSVRVKIKITNGQYNINSKIMIKGDPL